MDSQNHTNLVIAFTKEFKFLVFHVHENSVEVPCLGGTNLNCFTAPSKYLSCTNVCCRKQRINYKVNIMQQLRGCISPVLHNNCFYRNNECHSQNFSHKVSLNSSCQECALQNCLLKVEVKQNTVGNARHTNCMWQFSPLQDHILKHSTTGVNINSFIYSTPYTICNMNWRAEQNHCHRMVNYKIINKARQKQQSADRQKGEPFAYCHSIEEDASHYQTAVSQSHVALLYH